MMNDIELLNASLKGDQQSFCKIVNRYKSVICAITYNVTGDVSLSEDIAQETFLSAWKNLSSLRDKTKFKSWLYGIARNLSQNYLRKSGKDVTHHAVSLDGVISPPSEDSSPRELAISKEEEAILWRAIEEIPEIYRETLILFYRENQSIQSVAAALDITEDTVKQRLSRGRNLLRLQLAAFVEETLRRSAPKDHFVMTVAALLPTVVSQSTAAGVAVTASKTSTAMKIAAPLALIPAAYIGAFIGSFVGAIGGIIGFRSSLRNTKSQRERSFMLNQLWKIVALTGSYLLVLLGFQYFTVKSVPLYIGLNIGITVVFIVGLLSLTLWMNQRQAMIQKEEGTYVNPVVSTREAFRNLSKTTIYASLGGSIFGSVAWMIILSLIGGDPLITLLILVSSLVIFYLSTRACIQHPMSYFKIVMKTGIALMVMIDLLVIFRWDTWIKHLVAAGTRNAGYYHHPMVYPSINSILQSSKAGILVLVTVLYLFMTVLFYWRDKNLQKK